jgi:hypothetical protein
MRNLNLLAGAGLIAALLAATTGCSGERAFSPAASAATPAKTAKADARPLVKGTLNTHKTTLDLRIDYSFEAPSMGSATEVRLKVQGNESGRPIAIEIRPGSGLDTIRGLPNNVAMQNAASAEHVITVSPGSEGLHYVHVFVRAGDRSEALAIPMQVGKVQVMAKPAVMPQTLPDGRRVISMPSQP